MAAFAEKSDWEYIPWIELNWIEMNWNEMNAWFSIGGSLQDVILENSKTADYFKESELKEILLQVSMGLKYIHTSGLVHMDIKPSKCVWSVMLYSLK